VLTHLRAENWLLASLLYGSGLPLMECMHLRVKDIEFFQLQLTVREGKGDKDRITLLTLAASVILDQAQLSIVLRFSKTTIQIE
jgi:site-specific recombinase XerD